MLLHLYIKSVSFFFWNVMTISFNLYRFLVSPLVPFTTRRRLVHTCIWSQQSWMTTAEYKVACESMSAKEKKRENGSAIEMKTQEWKSPQSPLQFCRCVVAIKARFWFISGNLLGATDCKCYCVRTIRHLTMNESCECGHFILCSLLSFIILMWFHLPVDIKKYKKLK